MKLSAYCQFLVRKAGGQMSHSYTYDPLYRLTRATGTYTGANNKTASYALSMGYDNMHRITSKKQRLSQTGVQFDGTLHVGYDLTYTYDQDAGKKFQLDHIRDINYRTEEVPTERTNINNGHKYTYDANGNLVYINTSRVKKDGREEAQRSEKKYLWDEENRLLAVDENGFVSNYWYDADGERTVKTSGENEALYVNSEFSSGRTGTTCFSLYVSPYLVTGREGHYTKHIYIGSQRIASKVGDLDSYGADPRRISYAGNEADGITIDYKGKYALQLQSIKDRYKAFEVPYHGADNNDYVYGKNFYRNDARPEAVRAHTMGEPKADNDNFKEEEKYEHMQYYYHPDHLGSSSYITNLDGEVSQHIEYVPFGEVFIEERNNTWDTPYLFNAKELDEETGLYYYGARYYDPRLSLWMSVDPISNYDPLNSENYLDGQHNGGVFSAYNLNPYIYCYQNPVVLVDPNGKQVKAIKEWWMRNQMTTRTLGFVKGVGGVLEAGVGAVGGAATSWTGAGAVVGGLAVVHGSDVAASGFTQMITGNETSSFTSQGLQFAGMSKDNAELVDGGIGILLSVGSSAVVKLPNQATLKATQVKSATVAQQTNKSQSFFKNTRYTDKVLKQMRQGDYHSFPESVKAFETAGTVTKIKGGDGIIRSKLSIPGSYKGKEGVFEFIKEANGDINHRLFKMN